MNLLQLNARQRRELISQIRASLCDLVQCALSGVRVSSLPNECHLTSAQVVSKTLSFFLAASRAFFSASSASTIALKRNKSSKLSCRMGPVFCGSLIRLTCVGHDHQRTLLESSTLIEDKAETYQAMEATLHVICL